jgi:hypothetical protein
MTTLILRVDGTQEPVEARPSEFGRLLGADVLDTFSLRDGRRVWVDDLGHAKGLPINEAATRLYLSRCRPGTTHVIRGDVVIGRDV